MLNEQTAQALRCLIHLAGTSPIPASELANLLSISRERIGKCLIPFRREGIVASMPGITGGFYLRVAPDTLTLLDAVRIAEGGKSIGGRFTDAMGLAEDTKIADSAKSTVVQVGNALDDTMRGVTIAQLAGLPAKGS